MTRILARLTLLALAAASAPTALQAAQSASATPHHSASPNASYSATPGAAPIAARNYVLASPITDVAVTIYRNPYSSSEGGTDLDSLQGFALVTETRSLSIPAGETRIRFEGVADGIEPASAILTGLPDGLIEKNHDARVLSPSALVASSVGHQVTFVRTDSKSGKKTEIPGTLLADADGVVFQANSGEIEALRCSGLPETFVFEPTTETNATPTLSVLVRAPRPVRAQVRLSYLARGFDWKADYSATVATDGKSMSLGAWVTLANSNSVSFAHARTKVVAGTVNRVSGGPEPVDLGHPIRAECWPRGSTSDTPEEPDIQQAQPLWDGPGLIRAMDMSLVVYNMLNMPAPNAPEMLQEAVVTGARKTRASLVQEERLGDLKLYSVPDRTSVVSRQIKQVRLLDRDDIPVELLYRGEVDPHYGQSDLVLTRFVRTKNTDKNHLGLSLPSGHVSAFTLKGDTPMLLNEAPILDTAVNEDVELELGDSDDVLLSQVTGEHGDNHVDITNASDHPVVAEISLALYADERMTQADPAPLRKLKNGLPTFRVTVPANGTSAIHYRLQKPGTPRL